MAQPTGTTLSRPAIGVTGNSKSVSPSWICIRLALLLCGARAVRIQVGEKVNLRSLDGLIISGGDDIHPSLYGEEPEEGAFYDEERDAMEIECIDYALHIGLPLLGICRGHQLINTVMGGTLHRSVAKLRIKTSARRSLLPSKRVRIKPSSLQDLFGKSSIKVNSLHSQAVASVAPELREVAFDADEITQAVESVGVQPILGVQWHPEYLLALPSQLRIFRWLVKEARKHNTQEKNAA